MQKMTLFFIAAALLLALPLASAVQIHNWEEINTNGVLEIIGNTFKVNGVLDLAGNRLTNVGNPASPGDAVPKSVLDSRVSETRNYVDAEIAKRGSNFKSGYFFAGQYDAIELGFQPKYLEIQEGSPTSDVLSGVFGLTTTFDANFYGASCWCYDGTYAGHSWCVGEAQFRHWKVYYDSGLQMTRHRSSSYYDDDRGFWTPSSTIEFERTATGFRTGPATQKFLAHHAGRCPNGPGTADDQNPAYYFYVARG